MMSWCRIRLVALGTTRLQVTNALFVCLLIVPLEAMSFGNEEPYIHPECLEFLAPWSRDDTESIDCSGLDSP